MLAVITTAYAKIMTLKGGCIIFGGIFLFVLFVFTSPFLKGDLKAKDLFANRDEFLIAMLCVTTITGMLGLIFYGLMIFCFGIPVFVADRLVFGTGEAPAFPVGPAADLSIVTGMVTLVTIPTFCIFFFLREKKGRGA